MLKANSEVVSVEQLCVWRENGEWVDHGKAILIGFSNVTVEEVFSKHTVENVHLEGQIDGAPTEILPPRILRSYGYEIIWRQLAGSFLAGSRGTCSLRLFSHHRVRGDVLANLERPADGGTRSPEGTFMPGYHRLITDIYLRRQEALTTWNATASAGAVQGAAPMADERLTKRVVDELLCLHLGGPVKKRLDDYIDLVSRSGDDFTEDVIQAALRKECPRFHQELVTGLPQPRSLGRTSYITKAGKKHSVRWSTVVESLLLRMRCDSPALGSCAALYRVIRDIVDGGQTPTDKAIKGHFKKNYLKFFNKIRTTSRSS